MLHQTHFSTGDTGDLIACLRLTHMPTSTRIGTIWSVRLLRDAISGGAELPVERLAEAVATPDPEIKATIGARWTQVASDTRRALRSWENEPRRLLAQRIRTSLPTLEDAKQAFALQASDDAAERCAASIDRLAAAHGTTADKLVATAVTVEPMLRAATPETFEVQTVKSLGNHVGRVRKAVALVDPTAVAGREADLAGLSPAWAEHLKRIEDALPAHALSSLAIARRLAVTANRAGQTPTSLDGMMVAEFVDRERATHAETYVEKIRAAFRTWNAVADEGRHAVLLDLPSTRTVRQPDVPWTLVPAAIREPVDAILDRAVSVRAPGDWGNLIGEVDDDDAELGMAGLMVGVEEADQPEDGAPVLERGTRRNWRDCVKRAWQAAMDDPKVEPKPITLENLFRPEIAAAVVRGARAARRDRCEHKGEAFDPNAKGRYEHSLIEALHSVGREAGIPEQLLSPIEKIKKNIDPLIVGWKRAKDGARQAVYADRQIGARHAAMLSQFNELGALRRWFEAPGLLWSTARRPLAQGSKIRLWHAALARSALIAQIGQRVAPLRRFNLVRLRYRGEDRHLHLPAGPGHGWLIIPPIETKTMKQIKVRIDPETVEMIKVYIEKFLPVTQKAAKAGDDNPHLFPGADGAEPEEGGYAPGQGYLTKEKLNASFSRHMRKYCRLKMCLHVMRHICGKVILDQDPSAMGLVKELLGHKDIKTTQSYYAEVCSIVAQNRYLHLLEEGMRKALARYEFKIGAAQATTRQTRKRRT